MTLKEYIFIKLCLLITRQKALREYPYNNAYQTEANVLQKEIDALILIQSQQI